MTTTNLSRRGFLSLAAATAVTKPALADTIVNQNDQEVQQAVLDAASGKMAIDRYRNDQRRIVAIYDADATAGGPPIIETAVTNATFWIQFSYWRVEGGKANQLAVSHWQEPILAKSYYDRGVFGDGWVGIWKRTFHNAATAFFTNCAPGAIAPIINPSRPIVLPSNPPPAPPQAAVEVPNLNCDRLLDEARRKAAQGDFSAFDQQQRCKTMQNLLNLRNQPSPFNK